jgi:hypothetical protein
MALIALTASGCLWPQPALADGAEYAIDELLLLTTVECVMQGVDPRMLNQVWWLESKGNIMAEGAHGELGAWQFKPETWMWLASKWEQDQPDGANMPYAPHDPYWSTKLAVWAIAHGFEKHWTTYQPACGEFILPPSLTEYLDWLEADIASVGITATGSFLHH